MADSSEETSQDEKTEEPTTQRLEEFRKEGNVSQSKELTAFMVLVACCSTMYLAGPMLFGNLMGSMRRFLMYSGTTVVSPGTLGKLGGLFLESASSIIMPIAIVGFVAGVAGSIVQIGFNFSSKPLEPDLKRINPISGLKKIVSMNSLVEGFKSILKLSAVSLVAFLMVKSTLKDAPTVLQLETQELATYMGSIGFQMVGTISLALLVIAVLDVSYQRYRYHQKLMMTKKELKDEMKQREGDPLLKARIRSIQREQAQKRMMKDVETADAIITNPTHIAVAIKYDSQEMDAPLVVAKGADYIAQKIKEIGKKSNVPMVENVVLARALHKTVKVGRYIPKSLYQAVAEVLAYVYKLKNRFGP